MEEKCKNCKHFQMGISCVNGQMIFDPFAKAYCVKHNIGVRLSDKCSDYEEKKIK